MGKRERAAYVHPRRRERHCIVGTDRPCKPAASSHVAAGAGCWRTSPCERSMRRRTPAGLPIAGGRAGSRFNLQDFPHPPSGAFPPRVQRILKRGSARPSPETERRPHDSDVVVCASGQMLTVRSRRRALTNRRDLVRYFASRPNPRPSSCSWPDFCVTFETSGGYSRFLWRSR
jgi:hypothetical protein